MRLKKLDYLRAIAVILMIFFHLNYILVEIFSYDFLNYFPLFWDFIRIIGGFLFIFIAGFSFYLAFEKYGNSIYKKYFKTILNLFLLSFLITFLTYFFIREQLILFGILHFFALGFLFLLILKNFGYYNLIVALTIFIIGFYFPILTEKEYLFFLGFIYKGFYSADYYPIIPYFSYLLFGYLLAKYLSDNNKLNILEAKNTGNISKIFSLIGKHSLLIYIIHTPIIYVIIYITLKILN